MTLSPALRISVGLVALTVSLLLFGKLIGLAPDREKAVLESRKVLSETLAVQFSTAAGSGDLMQMRAMLSTIVKRDKDIKSAAVRQAGGKLLAVAGNHLENWKVSRSGLSTPTHVQVPVFQGKNRWGTVEISFTPLLVNSFKSGFKNSYFGLIFFIACGGFASYFMLIKWTLRELDPSVVIPERVRAAFDVLEEGVLILDKKEQVVLANKSFGEVVGKNVTDLVGFKGSEFGWKGYKTKEEKEQLPWMRVLHDGRTKLGVRLMMESRKGQIVTFIVNAAPVLDGKGQHRGVLVTFDNVTELERRNLELNKAVDQLQVTTEEVQSKNVKLEFLANHDPLTKLLNRRAFNRTFSDIFNQSQSQKGALSCVMCDIDHFKAVNDRYGHAAGDRVIKMVAELLKKHFRQDDILGRYGGEEFCAVLPGINIKKAAEIANRVRIAIREDSSSGVEVSMSFGVSSLEFKSPDPDELVNQADKALYIAKESGRNRVVCWGDEEIEDFVILDNESEVASVPQESVSGEASIEDGGPQITSLQDEENEEVKRLTIRLQEVEKIAELRAKEVEHFTAYDPLTGLPTRTLFNDRVSLALARGRRYDNIVAILAVSIDSVQRVNETLGHDTGDWLIQETARRLTVTLRDTDSIAKLPDNTVGPTISRMGHTEFGVLLTDLEDVNVITWIVKRILKSFETPFYIGDNEIYATTNVGISIYPHDGESPEVLEQNAAVARSHAKKHLGANSYYYYSRTINTVSVKHLNIENQLRRAITNDEFVLHYQPKVDLRTGEVNGSEALIRWYNPETGLVPPGEFIPIAEYSGLIGVIGEWVLDAACKQIRLWLDMGLENCSVAVNFSNKQFRNKNLAQNIRECLQASNIDPKYLIVEVTESVMMENIDSSLTILKEIREMGCSIALDDFGTGYSSLVYLKNIPVTHVKIDRSFVADIETNQKDATLVKSVISMAHGMGLKVTAEGVENRRQVDMLLEYGCDEMQGFLLSKPVDSEKVTEIIREGITF